MKLEGILASIFFRIVAVFAIFFVCMSVTLNVEFAGKEELTEEIWDKVFAVNVKGQFLCAQAAARAMLASGNGGVVINMTSDM